MSHLDRESLARLVDEEPIPEEARHLAQCERCSAELAALREQSAALGALPPIAPPDTAWADIETRLHDEGLVRPTSAGAGRRALRIAASVAALLAAGALGALIQARVGGARGTHPATVAVTGGTGARPATAAARDDDASEAAIQARLKQAEAEYVAALAAYDQVLQPQQQMPDASARLAALEGVVLTTGAALQRSPGDPVINGYHLTALAQREATLRRLAAAGNGPWF